jgi:hypothetical protein
MEGVRYLARQQLEIALSGNEEWGSAVLISGQLNASCECIADDAAGQLLRNSESEKKSGRQRALQQQGAPYTPLSL